MLQDIGDQSVNFNSTVVQLEGQNAYHYYTEQNNFNSTVVQLEVLNLQTIIREKNISILL